MRPKTKGIHNLSIVFKFFLVLLCPFVRSVFSVRLLNFSRFGRKKKCLPSYLIYWHPVEGTQNLHQSQLLSACTANIFIFRAWIYEKCKRTRFFFSIIFTNVNHFGISTRTTHRTKWLCVNCSSLPLKCHDFHKEKPIGFQFCAKILEINFNIDNKFKKSGWKIERDTNAPYFTSFETLTLLIFAYWLWIWIPISHSSLVTCTTKKSLHIFQFLHSPYVANNLHIFRMLCGHWDKYVPEI